jgi:fumarate reductase subunit D
MTDVGADWTVREKVVLERIEKQHKWHSAAAVRSFWTERALAIVVLVCAILAPLTVASADDAGLGVFGVPALVLKKLALVFTIIVALAEGFRRICKFDERYSISAQSREKLRFGMEQSLKIKLVLSRAASNGVRISMQSAR